MVARTVCLLYVLMVAGAWWTLEQPCNSLMRDHPIFNLCVDQHRLCRVSMAMGHFGSATLKPSWLYTNCKFAGDVQKYAQPFVRSPNVKLVRRHVDKSGRVRVSGNEHLKQSQSYPARFGSAMVSLFDEHRDEIAKWADQCQAEIRSTDLNHGDIFGPLITEAWHLADFDEAFDFLAKT